MALQNWKNRLARLLAAMDKNKSIIEDQLSLEYKGPATDTGRMDAYDAASAIMAFSDFLAIVSKTAVGQKAEVKTEIQAFRNESFDIDFAVTIGGTYISLTATGTSPAHIFSLLKFALEAWKHLKGSPPKSITHNEDGTINIENHYGDVNNYHGDVYNIIANPNAGKSVERFIKRPLESGLDEMVLKSKSSEEPVVVSSEDAKSFVAFESPEDSVINEVKMNLNIEAPAFKEGNKWKLNDGGTSFYAEMADEAFLQRVNENRERFGKGDTLIVRMKFEQVGAGATLRIEKTIVEVLEHQEATKQDGLF